MYTLPIDTTLALQLYNDWKVSNRVRFPFEGGRLQQPQWVLNMFGTLERIDELLQLERLRPKTAGLPTMDEVA